VQHTIRIHPSGGDKYRVTGAVDLYATGTPIQDAARALIAAGASPLDLMSVTGAEFLFSPTALVKLATPRKPPRRSDIERMWLSEHDSDNHKQIAHARF
jgi:hypothetical protein